MRKRLFARTVVDLITPLCFFALCINLDAADAGVVFRVETTYHSESDTRVEMTVMSIQGELLKMQTLSGNKNEAIFRGDSREMIVIDPAKKTYMVVDKKMIDAMASQFGDAQKKMQNLKIPEDALKRMPESERKRLEAMMNQQAGTSAGGTARTKREYRKTGEQATKQGYPCLKYDVLVDGKTVEELWVTDWKNVEGADEVKAALTNLGSFFKEMTDAVSEIPGVARNSDLFGNGNDPLRDFVEGVDGIPIVSREFENGDLKSETVLKSATTQNLPPSTFEPPEGYKRMEINLH